MIQVIGTKKCRATQRALRFFQERGVKVQFLDLAQRPLAAGELDNCARGAGGVEALLDTAGAAWRKRGMDHMKFDAREEALADNALLRTPIVRAGKTVLVGEDEAGWKAMAAAEK